MIAIMSCKAEQQPTIVGYMCKTREQARSLIKVESRERAIDEDVRLEVLEDGIGQGNMKSLVGRAKACRNNISW